MCVYKLHVCKYRATLKKKKKTEMLPNPTVGRETLAFGMTSGNMERTQGHRVERCVVLRLSHPAPQLLHGKSPQSSPLQRPALRPTCVHRPGCAPQAARHLCSGPRAHSPEPGRTGSAYTPWATSAQSSPPSPQGLQGPVAGRGLEDVKAGIGDQSSSAAPAGLGDALAAA